MSNDFLRSLYLVDEDEPHYIWEVVGVSGDQVFTNSVEANDGFVFQCCIDNLGEHYSIHRTSEAANAKQKEMREASGLVEEYTAAAE